MIDTEIIKHELSHLYAAAITCRLKGIPLRAFTVEFDPETTDLTLLPAASVTKAAAQSIVAAAAYGPIAAVEKADDRFDGIRNPRPEHQSLSETDRHAAQMSSIKPELIKMVLLATASAFESIGAVELHSWKRKLTDPRFNRCEPTLADLFDHKDIDQHIKIARNSWTRIMEMQKNGFASDATHAQFAPAL